MKPPDGIFCRKLLPLCNVWQDSVPKIKARQVCIDTVQEPFCYCVHLRNLTRAVEQHYAVLSQIEGTPRSGQQSGR